MSKESGLGARLFVGGYNLSGDIGSLSRIATPRGTTEVTGIDKLAVERLLTHKDGALDFSSWFNTAAGQAHPVLSALPRTDVIGTYCHRSTIGSPCFSMVGKQINYDPNRGNDAAFSFNTSMVANGYGAEWGDLLTAAPRTDTAATEGTGVGFAVGNTFLSLPGSAGNYASTPDAAALDITGDIDVRVKVAMDDWSPAATGYFIAKYTIAGAQRSYSFGIVPSGALFFQWSNDGTTLIVENSSAGLSSLSAGSIKWVRATLDADVGGTDAEVKFYSSDDGSTWTQLGATKAVGATTSIYVSTAVLELGSRSAGTTDLIAGKIYEAVVMNGIAGSEVAHPIAGATSISDATGLVWTINGTAFTSYDTHYGLQAYLQVGEFAGTDVTVKIQHSRDNATWSDVTGGGFTAVTASRTTERIQTSRTLPIERYLRVTTTTSAGFTSAPILVQVVKNLSEVNF